MTYEEIWQKIKAMSQRDRKMLAHEVSLSLNSSPEGKEAVGYIHPYYYFDAKAMHDILFYAPHSHHELDDKERKYYNALKEVMDNDKEIHIHYKRHDWLPRYINDKIETNIVKDYISHRTHGEVVKASYSISPVKDIAGERQRTMIITTGGCAEISECGYGTVINP